MLPVLVQTCRKTLCEIYSRPLHTLYTRKNSPGCHSERKREDEIQNIYLHSAIQQKTESGFRI